MLVRVLAVLAAVFLVGAIALASLAPRSFTLHQGLQLLDAELPTRVQALLARPAWLWRALAMPMMIRPAWFLPAGLGIVFAGLATSLSWTRGTPAQRRKRS